MLSLVLLVLAGGVMLVTYGILPVIGIASIFLDTLPISLKHSVKAAAAIAGAMSFLVFVLSRSF